MPRVAINGREAMAKANDLEICFETFGQGHASPLLLIMGLGAQMIVWDDAFCEQLAARGYWVIRFDNRDIGKSTWMDSAPIDIAATMRALVTGGEVKAPYLLRDMAADAVGLMDFLKIARAHIVGSSMGGMIAQEIAIRWPGRVLSLTSIMSTTSDPGLSPPSPAISAIFATPTPTTHAEYIDANVRVWGALRGPGFPADEAQDRRRAERAANRGFSAAGGMRQLLAVGGSGSRKSLLGRVTAPTLVIHGDADPLVPLAAGEDTARSIPGARLVVIPGMGHSMPIATWPKIIDEIASIAR
jgi:pimeloyl-ACP methyl ester carboxylesterase